MSICEQTCATQDRCSCDNQKLAEELEAHAVNELIDWCGPKQDAIDEVSRCFGMLIHGRKVQVVK